MPCCVIVFSIFIFLALFDEVRWDFANHCVSASVSQLRNFSLLSIWLMLQQPNLYQWFILGCWGEPIHRMLHLTYIFRLNVLVKKIGLAQCDLVKKSVEAQYLTKCWFYSDQTFTSDHLVTCKLFIRIMFKEVCNKDTLDIRQKRHYRH